MENSEIIANSAYAHIFEKKQECFQIVQLLLAGVPDIGDDYRRIARYAEPPKLALLCGMLFQPLYRRALSFASVYPRHENPREDIFFECRRFPAVARGKMLEPRYLAHTCVRAALFLFTG